MIRHAFLLHAHQVSGLLGNSLTCRAVCLAARDDSEPVFPGLPLVPGVRPFLFDSIIPLT